MAFPPQPETFRVTLSVVQVLERLDRDYLRRWAAELGVSDLLERALGKGME